jgi:hypothetical protein
MQTCKNCGEVVTPDFVRVFGTGREVYACPACATVAELVDAADEEPMTAE